MYRVYFLYPKFERMRIMKLPNGYGSVHKLSGNRRNPWRARKTTGWSLDKKTMKYKQEYTTLGYYPTKKDALQALAVYNEQPYDLDNNLTVIQLYERWSKEYFQSLKGKSGQRTITSAWAYCSDVYDIKVRDLRARHIKGCIDDGTSVVRGIKKTASAGTKSRIKSIFNLMLDYALEYEIVDRNYARTFNLSDDIIKEKAEAKRQHIPFTDREMEILWANVDKVLYVDVVLIQCYSGWRPQELGLIEMDRVDLDNWEFTGGIKTDAGIDRLVPIHPRIRELVKQKYDEAIRLGSDYLINCIDSQRKNDIKMTYDKYNYRFERIRDTLKLNPEHRPHDPRKHFSTMAKKYKVDEYALKYMIGHKIEDITEKVYTQRDVNWLKEEIEKIV